MTAATPAQVLDALTWRYATKVFDPGRSIPDETWAALVRSLVLAPSSFGLQPWRFLVIDDPAVRSALHQHSWDQPQIIAADRLVVLTTRTDLAETDIDRWIECLAASRTTSPEALRSLRDMITGFTGTMHADARRAWCVRQVYLALGQLITAAAMLGIDTCPIEGIDTAAYDRELALEGTGYATAVACALGYRSPADKYATLPKARFPHDQVVRII